MSCAGGCGFHGTANADGLPGLFCSACAKLPPKVLQAVVHQQQPAAAAAAAAPHKIQSAALPLLAEQQLVVSVTDEIELPVWPCPECSVQIPLHVGTCDICYTTRPGALTPPIPGSTAWLASVAAAAATNNSVLIRDIPIGTGVVDALCTALLDTCSALREIAIETCHLDDALTVEFAGRVLARCSSLRCISLAWNAWGDAGLTSVVEALKVAAAPVESLYLSHGCAVSARGITALTAWLGDETCTVRTLQLDENKIGDEGVCALAAALRRNPAITSLELVAVGMSEVGANALCDSIASWKWPRQCRTLEWAGNELAESCEDRRRALLLPPSRRGGGPSPAAS